jgi:hypothetical protein
MNHALPPLLLAVGVALVATVSGPQPASADAVTECTIAHARADGSTAARHTYQFEVRCSSEYYNAFVNGAYDVASGRTIEVRTGPSGPPWRVLTSLTCPADPWTDPTGEFQKAGVSCTEGQFIDEVGNRGQEELSVGYFNPSSPWSMRWFGPSERVGLAGLLQQAIAGQGTDLTVTGMSGPGALPAGLSGTYTVTVKNEGGVGATLELVIVFAGKLDQTGQIVAGAGLYCEVRHNAGINAALYCNGGQLGAGATASVIVQGRGQSAGGGTLIATLNNSRAVEETSYDNNLKQLNVTIN